MAFKKPEKVISGTKILIFGEPGTRKSRTALTFPKIAYINADQGADDYFEEFSDNLTLVSDATTFSEVVEDLEEIETLEDDVITIVLDSDTKIYENQQHTALRVAEQRARKAKRAVEGEGLSPKEWGIIKLNHEKMLSQLFEHKKDGKIIVVIAEAKDEKEAITDANNNVSWKTIGLTPNSQKGLEFDFDIVLEMIKDKKTDTFVGAKVRKDRLGVTEEGEILENPSFDIWKERIEAKRTGGTKQKKRDFSEDIKKDMDTFDLSKPIGKSAVSASDLQDKIQAGLDKVDEKLKTPLAKKFKEIAGTAKYREVEDVEQLQDMLKAVEEKLPQE